jgi:hypothetical protein
LPTYGTGGENISEASYDQYYKTKHLMKGKDKAIPVTGRGDL